MAVFTSTKERDVLREAGRRLASVLDIVEEAAQEGATGKELDALAEKCIREGGDIPAFLNYTPEGAVSPFPATLCVSVNDEVVHGIPNDTPFKKGDLVSLDIGLIHQGIVVDMARTVCVGDTLSESDNALMHAVYNALIEGINTACVGNTVGDIGHAVECVIKKAGFSVVVELGGHGVGRVVHEEPFVPNMGTPGTGEKLVDGMVLALEPIASTQRPEIKLKQDGYTVKTKDGSRSAHFEHTILITNEGTEVVTQIQE